MERQPELEPPITERNKVSKPRAMEQQPGQEPPIMEQNKVSNRRDVVQQLELERHITALNKVSNRRDVAQQLELERRTMVLKKVNRLNALALLTVHDLQKTDAGKERAVAGAKSLGKSCIPGCRASEALFDGKSFCRVDFVLILISTNLCPGRILRTGHNDLVGTIG
jgi:hypothetical protein